MNNNLIRANMELADSGDINTILKVDANLFSTKPSAYIKQNSLNYYTCVNTWLLIIKGWSKYGWVSVKHNMLKCGLIAVIARFNSAANSVVNREVFDDTLVKSIIRDIKNCSLDEKNIPTTDVNLIGDDPIATILFVLRYPKRFSPVSNDIIRKDSIDKFLSVENRSKLLQRHEYPTIFVDEMRDLIKHSFPWAKICKRISKLDASDISFTTGVGFDSNASLGSKLNAISKTNPEFFYAPFGKPQNVCFLHDNLEFYGAGLKDGNPHKIFSKRSVKISAVPKSYKAARIIATENTFRQGMAKRIFLILDDYLPDGIDLHSQIRNQDFAYFGSCYGIYSTTDLSNASDCITKTLVKQIFPYEFWSLIEPFIPTHYIIDGKERLMQQFSTAGNSLTFIIESIVFWAIAKCAISRYLTNNTSKIDAKREIRDISTYYGIDYPDPSCSVYGDDIIVWNPATPYLHTYLEALGFIINEEKTFSSSIHLYRESCGKEYYKGIDMTTLYYPRSPIQGELGRTIKVSNHAYRDSLSGEYFDSTVKLVDLQHKLYAACYPASILLSEIVKEAHPKMTTSVQDSLFGDLWDYDDTSIVRPHKCYEYQRWGNFRCFPDGSKILLSEFEKKIPSTTDIVMQEGRYLPRASFKLSKELTSTDHLLYDLYKYQNFLKYGPRYEDSLLKLLNISSKPTSITEVFGRPVIDWKIRF